MLFRSRQRCRRQGPREKETRSKKTYGRERTAKGRFVSRRCKYGAFFGRTAPGDELIKSETILKGTPSAPPSPRQPGKTLCTKKEKDEIEKLPRKSCFRGSFIFPDPKKKRNFGYILPPDPPAYTAPLFRYTPLPEKGRPGGNSTGKAEDRADNHNNPAG